MSEPVGATSGLQVSVPHPVPPRNIVLMTDGTGNEPKLRGESNVLRLYKMLTQDDHQLVWYDPGVGTEGDPRALTNVGKKVTKFAGLVVGYGLKQNVMDGYTYLMNNYRTGDRIYLFGFSRGAYTARAIAGLLFQIGLLRPGQENLIPYALRLFWWHQGYTPDQKVYDEADEFSRKFSRPDFQRRRKNSIRYAGVWDTVKATGFARRNLILPWTAQLPAVSVVSHAVSIDERRRPYKPILLSYSPQAHGVMESKRLGQFKEVWFVGVHSDVGGTFESDPRLANISLEWVVQRAIDQGLLLDVTQFALFKNQPRSNAEDKIHDMGLWWGLTEIGNHRKIVPDGASLYESVKFRSEHDTSYRPMLPIGVK
jgi:uncharacterized protein (DUF2235 family)